MGRDVTIYAMETAKYILKKIPIMTVLIVVINVGFYIVNLFMQDALWEWGETGVLVTVDKGQWYRLLSATVLHVGIEHLVFNMLVIVFVGDILECVLPKVWIPIIFVFTGVLGNVVSLFWEYLSGEYTYSVGASGACFGFQGVLITLVCFGYVRGETMGFLRIFIAVALSLYSGFTDTHINNAAHVGGLVAGLLIGLLVAFVGPKRRVIINGYNGEKTIED